MVTSLAAEALSRTIDLLNIDLFSDRAPRAAILEALMDTTIAIVADRRNATSPAGQTAIVTLVSQLAMLGVGLNIDVPDIALESAQPPLGNDDLLIGLVTYASDLIPGARVQDGRNPDLTIVLGDSAWRGASPSIRISGSSWAVHVDPQSGLRWSGTWPMGALAAGPVGASIGLRPALLKVADRTGLPLSSSFIYHLEPVASLRLGSEGFVVPSLNVGALDFISAGAITQAAVYCLLRLPGLSGNLRTLDSDIFDLPNLNRYPLGRRAFVNMPKADLIATFATPDVSIEPIRSLFSADTAIDLSSTVMVGVDDIPSRWAVQRRDPDWLSVGGTTHNFAVVSTHMKGQPCAGCMHPRDESLQGTIPTISFVSFWAGLLQATSLIRWCIEQASEFQATQVWPFSPDGQRPLLSLPVAARSDCPVGCTASEPLRTNSERS